MKRWLGGAVAAAVLCLGTAAAAAPQVTEGDYVVRDFRFRSGEALPELRLHYRTVGTPKRDAMGRVTNAVMVLHGTGGSGAQFLRPQFADVLFAPGGELDPAEWYVILPDGIGHGASSKPSDGLRAKFPEYDYDDMVAAQHALLTQGLKVDRLRLLMGTSMGCMHAFVWGETYPGFAQALMPMACIPTEIAGRNRVWRKLAMDAIRSDPAWMGGNYAAQPLSGLRAAQSLLIVAGGAPIPMHQAQSTRELADKFVEESMARALPALDANDLWYQINASRTYDPSEDLEKITVPVTWINSADDFINPPELGLAEQFAPRLKNGRYILIPAGPEGKGHGTHTWARFWKDEVRALLEKTGS